MQESEIIQGVIEVLTKPESWIKNIRAMVNGMPTNPDNPQANQFCLGGAVMRVVGNECWWEGWYAGSDDPIGHRFELLAHARGFLSTHANAFVEFNNSPETTHEDVLLFLKEALYQAEMEEAERDVNV